MMGPSPKLKPRSSTTGKNNTLSTDSSSPNFPPLTWVSNQHNQLTQFNILVEIFGILLIIQINYLLQISRHVLMFPQSSIEQKKMPLLRLPSECQNSDFASLILRKNLWQWSSWWTTISSLLKSRNSYPSSYESFQNINHYEYLPLKFRN